MKCISFCSVKVIDCPLLENLSVCQFLYPHEPPCYVRQWSYATKLLYQVSLGLIYMLINISTALHNCLFSGSLIPKLVG